MIGLARRLAAAGVVGINRRNADFILRYNKRRDYPLVDDKYLTKALAGKSGVAVPALYAMLEAPVQIRRLAKTLAPYPDFVVKPARGSGGDGIVVVTGRIGDHYRLANGAMMARDDLEFHVSNVLAGSYSLGGQVDKALVEYRVRFDPLFERIAYQGVPDIRIIVFLGVPVLAMVRLPTRESGGRANLHQGAVAAGIEIASGRTFGGVWHDRPVETHPDTLNPIAGIQIPGWDALLLLAARSWEMTGLGYQGIDIVLDCERGPLMLELNARPGLAIQIANRRGLGHRLERVERQGPIGNPDARVAFAKATFDGDR